jgi:hypothetical protein
MTWRLYEKALWQTLWRRILTWRLFKDAFMTWILYTNIIFVSFTSAKIQNIQCSRIIIAFTVASADAKDKIINVQELLLLRSLKNYCCFYCSEDMRNIELLLPLLFKKICRIFTTVHICYFSFVLAHKRLVWYVRR